MEIFTTCIFFFLGLVFGSFFHVVGYRLPKGESLIEPKKSYCPTCNHKLGAIDLIPVFSYLFNFGKCRYCKSKISVTYPVIELVTGVLFATSYHLFGMSYELLNALILSGLLSIVLVSDLEYLIIPDSVTLTGGVLLIIVSFFQNGIERTAISLLYGLLAFLLMYLLMLLGNFLFKKESLGGADIKLMFLSGFLLGPILSLVVIFLSSLIALPIAMILYIKNKENMIAYGPFLILAMIILCFLQIDVSILLQILSF